ncbi:hypothetical protein ACFYZJ_24930 [Streptomyces sp. NPDC001848]|uniref:hypothetical protein n=1 Tax=Streptomyces sp. NPDC001848 TaxID=3364618 RepID=UPI00369F8A0E
MRWSASDPTELVIGATSALGELPSGTTTLVLTADKGRTAVLPVQRTPQTESFTARVDVRNLTAGLWRGELRIGDRAEWSVPLPALRKTLGAAKWRRRGLPWYAKPVRRKGDRFLLRVSRTDLIRAVARRVKP